MSVVFMGTTERHMKILDALTINLLHGIKNDKAGNCKYGREQLALVKNHEKLIDINQLTNIQIELVKKNINTMKIVQPDFFVFKNNKHIANEKITRYVGVPDLIVEVWSDTNTKNHRDRLRNLYVSSGATFWEIEQNSPKVICWNNQKAEEYLLKDIDSFPWGQKIDLIDLYHDVKDVEIPDEAHGGYDTGSDIDLEV
jgi:hypothetical protein